MLSLIRRSYHFIHHVHFLYSDCSCCVCGICFLVQEVKPEDNEGKPRNNSSDEKDVSPTLSPSDEVPNTKEPTVIRSVADVASS